MIKGYIDMGGMVRLYYRSFSVIVPCVPRPHSQLLGITIVLLTSALSLVLPAFCMWH